MPRTITITEAEVARLKDLLTDVEADFGFEYANQTGLAALRELRKLIGGQAHPNVADLSEGER